MNYFILFIIIILTHKYLLNTPAPRRHQPAQRISTDRQKKDMPSVLIPRMKAAATGHSDRERISPKMTTGHF